MHPRLACLLPSRRSCCILRAWESQTQSQRAARGQESQDAGGARTGPDFSMPPLANNLAETVGWVSKPHYLLCKYKAPNVEPITAQSISREIQLKRNLKDVLLYNTQF